jgi:hypothetical protein
MTTLTRSVQRAVLALASLASLIALAAAPPASAFQAPAELFDTGALIAANGSDLEQQYLAAMEDAKGIPTRSKISTNLLAVVPPDVDGDGNLHPDPINYQKLHGDSIRRDAQGRVLVASLMALSDFEQYYEPYLDQDQDLDKSLWVTVAPELSNRFVGETCPPSNLRVKQALGLNPAQDYRVLVEMWAHPSDLFRPTPDPEITDHEAELAVPSASDPPWWTLPAQLQRFVQLDYFDYVIDSAWSAGPLTFPEWYGQTVATNYNLDGPIDTWGSPWTRLGYTYDWGDPDDHHGLSEFILNLNENTDGVYVPVRYERAASTVASSNPRVIAWDDYFRCGPAAPTLTATSETGLADLSWTAIAGADGYALLYNETARGAPFQAPFNNQIDLGDVTWLNAVVESGKTYYAAIQAYNESGPGALSNIVYLHIP